MQSGRRHACAVCRKAKAADEFPIGTSKSSLKGEWVCTECGGVSPSRIPTPALGARPMSAAATTFVAAAAPAESFTPPVSRAVAPAPSAAAPAKLGSLKTATIAQVVTAWVTAANEFVKSKISPTPWPGAAGNPQLPAVQIPYIDRLLKHAASLDPKDPDVVHRLYMIISLMGRAGSYNIAIPDPTKGLKFPLDHHFHPSWPQEWYYVCTKIPIKDSKGNVGEIAFLASIIRQRSVGLDQQQAAGWSDFQTTTMNYVSSATIRLYDPKDSTKCVRSIFARATPNAFWGVLDKPDDQYSMFYSKPGEVFGIGCGTTSIISTQPANSPEILPAKLTVDDKAPSGNSNIKISCTLAAAPGVSKSQGWFYQGVPQPNPKNPTDLNGCPGTGFSLTPTPGIYYSWPQVVVANASVNVNGEDFIVTGNGNGWIDHEVITASLFNYDPATNTFPVEPIPFREDASPMQGWTWQFCNMANGKEAWTGSTFVFGNASMSSLSPSPTGYYVTLGSDGIYKGAFASGATLQTPNMTVTSPSGMSSTTPLPFVSVYQVANDRTYLEGYGSWLPFTATGSGWTDPKNNPIPAIFNTNDFGTICEVPAQFVNAVTKSPVGWGYLESQGFEGQFPFMNRLLYYLESKNYPVSPLVEIVTA